jgi:hypothetical protein
MSSYKIANIEKLLEELKMKVDFNRLILKNEQYAQGIEYCIKKLQEILDT